MDIKSKIDKKLKEYPCSVCLEEISCDSLIEDILSLTDDRWEFIVKCRQRTEACTFFGIQPKTCPDGFSTRICTKKRPATIEDILSGKAIQK